MPNGYHEAELGCLPESVLGIVRHGPKRRCLQSMIVGQTSVFYPGDEEIGTELAIFKSVEEPRWVKDAGWKFSIETGCFVSRADQLARLFGAPSADVAGLLMEDGLRRAERREARKNAHKNAHNAHNSVVEG